MPVDNILRLGIIMREPENKLRMLSVCKYKERGMSGSGNKYFWIRDNG